MLSIVLLSLLAGAASAQQSAYGQCGGVGYGGATTCVSGYSCVLINEWYSQCQPGVAPTSTSSRTSTTTPTSTPSSPPASGSTASPAQFRYLGRVNPATKELTWPSTGVAFTFTGTRASIALTQVTGANSVSLIVDGKETIIENVAGTSITTPAGLSAGTHTVSVRKRSEAYMGSIFVGAITTDGSFSTATPPTRRIEIIGDSISVGYGLDGVNPCTNTAVVEDNPKTAGALAAVALKADYSVVAWSGKGLVRNINDDSSPLMPTLYTRYGANDADGSYPFSSTWVPDAVVIGLGTNDFNYGSRSPLDASLYTAGMVKFVKSIQTHYPNAHFFLLSSPMLSDTYPTAADAQKTTQINALKAAVTQLNSAKVHFVDWPTQGADVGCDYHPNAATNAAQAKVLTTAIGTALGW